MVPLASRQRSAAGRTLGSHSAPIVPWKPGNPDRGDPGEGSGASSYQTVGGKHDGDIGLRNRVHATTTDSTVGETDAGEGIDLPEPAPRFGMVARSLSAHGKDGAAGIDGQTAADYERDLEGNLRSLLERAKSGTYWAPPVRRVYIPKGTGGETRPIGIPTLEDKVLQRAIVMLLEPIYEADFYDCSYGFRPGRSAYDAWIVSRSRPCGAG